MFHLISSCTFSIDSSKVNSCQPSCLMMRSDSSFNSPSHESAIIESSRSGALAPTADGHLWSTTETSEHEHSDSTATATGLQSSRGASQARRQRESKVHRVHPVSRTISQRQFSTRDRLFRVLEEALDRVLPAVPRLLIIDGGKNDGKHCGRNSARVDSKLDL